jgi:uncharacterized Zn-finger protein
LGIKEFICDTVGCEKMFRRKADLKRHQRQHKYFFLISGEKNYICEACGKPFARKDALDRHLNPGTKESACKLRIQLNRLQQQNDTQERPLKRSKVE